LNRHTLTNYAGLIVPGACEILLVPVLLHSLGEAQYGVWAALVAVTVIVAAFEAGLMQIITRGVAAFDDSSDQDEFLGAVLAAYLLLGFVGGLCVAVSALLVKRWIQLPADTAPELAVVFTAGGTAFLLDRIRSYCAGALRGARRFDLVNALAIATSLIWAGGVVVIVSAGLRLQALSIWWSISSAFMAAVAIAVLPPNQRPRRLLQRRWSLRPLQEHLSLGMASQATMIISAVIWEFPALLIGAMLGSARIATYQVARQFPAGIYELGWRAGEVVFPASVQYDRMDDTAGIEEVLEVATRWIIFTTLPASLILYMVAPRLLAVWVGSVEPETLAMFRIFCLAGFADAISAGVLNVLWGQRKMMAIVKISTIQAIVSLSLCAALLPRFGVVGSAWALLIPIPLCAVAFFYLVCSGSWVGLAGSLGRGFRGLVLPSIACAGIALTLNRMITAYSWLALIAISGAGLTTFVVLALVRPINSQERNTIHAVVRWSGKRTRRLSTCMRAAAFGRLR
jgi:O-antigen/teichoic acid export membrane protein